MKEIIMKDIAREVGVSVTTVSHAINNTRPVSETTKTKIFEAMDRLDYKPNNLARSLRKKSTKTIGIIISDIGNPYFTQLVRACEDTAHEHDYNIILCNSDDDPVKEELYLNILRSEQIDGIILSPCGSTSHIAHFLQGGLSAVFVDRHLEGLNVDYVGVDNIMVSQLAVDHLFELGYRRIAIVTAMEDLSSTQERIKGYRMALERHGLPFDKDLVLSVKGDCEETNVMKAFEVYLETATDVDCFFAINNVITLGIIGAINRKKLRCPQDIALMGVCDFSWSWKFQPYLTMIDLPIYEIGKKATNVLISRIKNGSKQRVKYIELPPKLIVRDSCGAVNGSVIP